MSKPTILIVEDEAIIAADLASKLGKLSYEVIGTTARGEDAVEMACSLKPDIVLMDIRLKGSMDGIEAAEEIRRRHSAPVIYLTAHSDSKTLERAKQSEPFGFILKPFDERELSTSIEMALYMYQSDRQLREQREWLRVTLTSIGDAVITCDSDGRVTFLNPTAEALSCWKTDEARNRPIQEVFRLINELTRQPPEDPVALVLRKGRIKALENHTALVTRNGQEISIAESAAPILDADGRVIGVVVVFHDVTEKRRAHLALQKSEALLKIANDELQTQNKALALQWEESKQTEAALRKSERKFQLVFNQSPVGLILLDCQGVVLDCNPHFANIFNSQREKYSGMNLLDKLPKGPVHQNLVDAIASDKIQYYEGPYTSIATGKQLFISISSEKISTDLIIAIITDITDRKMAEEAILDSENRFRAAFLGSPMAMAISTLNDGVFIDVNQAELDMFGFTRNEVIGENSLDMNLWVNPTDRRRFISALGQSGDVRNQNVQLRRKDGSLIHASVSAVSLTLKGVKHVLFVTEDITERKLTEEALSAKSRTLESVFECAPYIMMLVNEEGRVIEINRSGVRFTGRNKDELLGLLGGEVFGCLNSYNGRGCGKNNECEFCPVRSRVMLTFETGEPVYESKGRLDVKVNGVSVTLDMLVSTSLVQTKNGRQVLVTIADITDRTRAEVKLRQSQALLAKSQEIAHVGSWQFDLATSRLNWSDEVYRILGLEPQEVAPTYDAFLNIVHPEDRAVVDNAYTASIQERRDGYTIEHRVVRKSTGEIRHVIEKCEHVKDSSGLIVRSIGMVQDITERKLTEMEKDKLQAQLLQAQKMESVGRLAGGVAHDFNNMLSIILGHAEMALDRVGLSQPLHDDIEEIRKAADRSADLTRQLLAFARKQTISPKILDLNETVEGMLKMLRRLIGEDIALTWQPGMNLWQVKVDPSQIDQILANLCINARDAISGVGKMTIETANRILDEEYCASHPDFTTGEYVRLTVSDNGCGIDREIQAHIFEPFFTTKEIGKGTGLGLATVFGIVKQNNGFINVSSEPGNGTTFTIYLPRHVDTSAKKQKTTPAEIAVLGHGTILLVEDEQVILNMTKMMLERQGYTVLASSTPDKAILLAREYAGDIHLLMTDVVMPEMNGRDLAGKLSALYPKLKRLFMSGYTADIIAHHGVLDPGVNFIQKPFSMKSLANKVRESLDDAQKSS